MSVRLDRLLANLGYGSRRDVKALVGRGRVTVGGQPARDPGAIVRDPAAVAVDGQPLDHPGPLLLRMHKPAGVACSHDPREAPLLVDLLPERWRRRNPAPTTVGRLDRDTTGVILVTDVGPLVQRLASPRAGIDKVYRATVDRDPEPDAEERFGSGRLALDGDPEPCAPAVLRRVAPAVVEVVLTEGRYHQVKRMLAAVGSRVVALHRVRFGPWTADDLAPGTWAALDPADADLPGGRAPAHPPGR